MSITSWFPVRRLLTPMLSKKCWKLGTIKSFWKLSKENGVFFRVKQIELNLLMFIPFHSEQNYVMLISRNFQNRKNRNFRTDFVSYGGKRSLKRRRQTFQAKWVRWHDQVTETICHQNSCQHLITLWWRYES